MDPSAVGIMEIAELVGAVALVASLIFNRRRIAARAQTTSRAAALQANMMFWKDFFALMADPETGRTYARGARGAHRP